MNFYGISELAVAIIAFIGIVAWGLGGRSRQSTNDAIIQENTSLRNQLGDAQTEVTTLKVRVENAEKNEQTFKDIAIGKPDFNKLSIQLATQHKEILRSFKGMTESNNTTMQDLTKGISNLATIIAKDRKDG